MFNTSINKNAITNLEQLIVACETAPAKLQRANDLAARSAQQKIEADLRKRGRPGRFIAVDYKKYGQYGLKFSFDIKPGRGGSRGGSKGRKYSAIWAGRVFLWSEMGMTGRRAFTLPAITKQRSRKENRRTGDYIREVTVKEDYDGRYRISHSSGRWREGQTLIGPLRIPKIGPFYFSASTGKPRKKITKFAAETITIELNKQYDKVIGKMAGRK